MVTIMEVTSKTATEAFSIVPVSVVVGEVGVGVGVGVREVVVGEVVVSEVVVVGHCSGGV